MADFQHVNPGDPSRRPPARDWNGAMDAARAHRDSTRGRTGGPVLAGTLTASLELHVVNETGANVPVGGPVRLDVEAYTIDVAFGRKPAYRAKKPTGNDTDVIVIAQEPIVGYPAGNEANGTGNGTGVVAILGHAVASVDVASVTHRYATAEANNTAHLVSNANAGFPLLGERNATGLLTLGVLLDRTIAGEGGGGATRGTHVLITGPADGEGYWPCTPQVWNGGGWVDGPSARVFEPNYRQLVERVRYEVTFYYASESEEESDVYVAQARTATHLFVTDNYITDEEDELFGYYPCKAQYWDGTEWVDALANDTVKEYAFEPNEQPLVPGTRYKAEYYSYLEITTTTEDDPETEEEDESGESTVAANLYCTQAVEKCHVKIESSEADDDGYYQGTLQVYYAGDWIDAGTTGAVLVFEPNDEELTQGRRYGARFYSKDDDEVIYCTDEVSVAEGGNSIPPPARSLLINGTFRVHQRQRQRNSARHLNGNYSWDRWFTQHDGGNNLVWSCQQFGPTGTSSSGQVANSGNATAGLLTCQPIENVTTIAARGSDLYFALSALATANVTVHMEVFAYTGGSAAASRNLVASWDGNHTPTFATTSLIRLGNSTIGATTGVWHDGCVPFTVPGNCTYLTAAMWVEGLAAGESIYFARATIQPDGTAWEEPTPQQTVADCSRYYFAPAWTERLAIFGNSTAGYSVNGVYLYLDLPPMRTHPTFVSNITGPIPGPGGGESLLVSDLTRGAALACAGTVGGGCLTIGIIPDSDNIGGSAGYEGPMYRRISVTSTANWTGLSGNATPATGDTILLSGAGLRSIAFDCEI